MKSAAAVFDEMHTAACTGDAKMFFAHVDEALLFANIAKHSDAGVKAETTAAEWRKDIAEHGKDGNICSWTLIKSEDVDGGHRIEATAKMGAYKRELLFNEVNGQMKLTDWEATNVGRVAPAEPVDMTVDVAQLLKEYKDNELRGDSKYKGKRIRIVNGKAGEFKRDIANNIYMTVGSGNRLEIPTAQCFFGEAHANEVALLTKGADVVVNCTVEGLMMNVLMKDCSFPSMTTFNVCSKLYDTGIAKDCEWVNGAEQVTGFHIASGADRVGLVELATDDNAYVAFTSALSANSVRYAGLPRAHIVVIVPDAPSPDIRPRVQTVLDHLASSTR
jgi:hypothetical protein